MQVFPNLSKQYSGQFLVGSGTGSFNSPSSSGLLVTADGLQGLTTGTTFQNLIGPDSTGPPGAIILGHPSWTQVFVNRLLVNIAHNTNPRLGWVNAIDGATQQIWVMDMASNTLRWLYRQEGASPIAEAQMATFNINPNQLGINNFAATERIALHTGTAGNRGVIKTWDVTAAAYRYAYIDNGAWVIAAAEPT